MTVNNPHEWSTNLALNIARKYEAGHYDNDPQSKADAQLTIELAIRIASTDKSALVPLQRALGILPDPVTQAQSRITIIHETRPRLERQTYLLDGKVPQRRDRNK
jgi:adenylate kinase family enzyme